MVTYEQLTEEEDAMARMGPSEFYFDAEDIDGQTFVTIVPRVFWDKEGYLWDQCFGLDNIVPPHLQEISEATWESEKSPDDVRADMLKLGFLLKEGIGQPQDQVG